MKGKRHINGPDTCLVLASMTIIIRDISTIAAIVPDAVIIITIVCMVVTIARGSGCGIVNVVVCRYRCSPSSPKMAMVMI